MIEAEYFLSSGLYKKPIRLLSSIAVCLSILLQPFATHADSAAPPTSRDFEEQATEAQGSLKITQAAGPQALEVHFQVAEVEASEAPQKVSEAFNTIDSDLLIVSSDEEDVLKQVVAESESQPRGRVFLLPFGKAIDTAKQAVGGINEALRFTGHYFVNAFKRDKIGVSIATFTMGNEVVRWLHVSTASNFVITSNIIYSILWSSIFLDKDTWSKVTKPIQRTYRRAFRMSEVIPTVRTRADLGIKFLSGLTLSLILNGGRVAIVGIDQLARSTFAPLALTMPFVMGAVMTAAGFSWSELIGSIDESQSPRAKKRLRFIMNSRSCLISYFAASAMLMNPSAYGVSPWIAVTLSGASGLFLYSNAAKFVPLLERVGLKRSRAQICQAAFSGL